MLSYYDLWKTNDYASECYAAKQRYIDDCMCHYSLEQMKYLLDIDDDYEREEILDLAEIFFSREYDQLEAQRKWDTEDTWYSEC